MKIMRYLKGVIWLVSTSRFKRRRARQEITAMIASAMGDFVVLDDYLLWREDTAFRRRFRELSPENRFSDSRKWTVREYARLVRDLPGDAAECGTYRGAAAWFICDAMPDTTVHLFDSFEGLSTPGQEDKIDNKADESYWNEGDMRAQLVDAQKTLEPFHNTRFHPGWIPERFHEVDDRAFKFVHVDVDLYQPTLDSIEFFWPRLVPGGVMVFDDYGFSNCPGANAAVDEFFSRKGIHVLHLPTGQGVAMKPPA